MAAGTAFRNRVLIVEKQVDAKWLIVSAILRLVQTAISLIVLICVHVGGTNWNFIYFTAVLAVVTSLVLQCVELLQAHKTVEDRWHLMVCVLYAFVMICYFIAGSLAAALAAPLKGDRLFRERYAALSAAAVFCWLNWVVYLLSAIAYLLRWHRSPPSPGGPPLDHSTLPGY